MRCSVSNRVRLYFSTITSTTIVSYRCHWLVGLEDRSLNSCRALDTRVIGHPLISYVLFAQNKHVHILREVTYIIHALLVVVFVEVDNILCELLEIAVIQTPIKYD